VAEAFDPTRFLGLAVRGLAELDERDVRGKRLGLELALSVWLRRAGGEVADLPRPLLFLRDVFLDLSALDAATEPVPLVMAEPSRAVTGLCVYLHALLDRAAGSVGLDRSTFAERAVSRLAAEAAATRLSS
jgi:hypothetical protein